MIITINEKYRISTDAYQWRIDKKVNKKKDGREWEAFKFYGTLDQAVNGLANMMIRSSEAETIADALKDIENVSAELSRALTPKYKVTEE